jgi:hypothetical protein
MMGRQNKAMSAIHAIADTQPGYYSVSRDTAFRARSNPGLFRSVKLRDGFTFPPPEKGTEAIAGARKEPPQIRRASWGEIPRNGGRIALADFKLQKVGQCKTLQEGISVTAGRRPAI